jgi:hypothetical protein
MSLVCRNLFRRSGAASHRFHYRADRGKSSTESGVDGDGRDAPVIPMTGMVC